MGATAIVVLCATYGFAEYCGEALRIKQQTSTQLEEGENSATLNRGSIHTEELSIRLRSHSSQHCTGKTRPWG